MVVARGVKAIESIKIFVEKELKMRCPECGQKECCGASMSKEIKALEEKCASMERVKYDELAGALIAGISAERDILKARVAELEIEVDKLYRYKAYGDHID